MKKFLSIIEFFFYFLNNKFKFFLKSKFKLNRKKVSGKQIVSAKQGNDELFKLIENGKPFCATRYGYTESRVIISGVFRKFGLKNPKEKQALDTLCNWSGFFPNHPELSESFADVYINASKKIDLLAFFDSYMIDYIIKKFTDKNMIISEPRAFEPYFHSGNNPWSKALKGKRVLVIHPFTKSIKNQYAKREKLFEDPEILPEFELYTLKAVQTITGIKDERFETWFDALDYMVEEAMKIPFDIAIIGCGAYGLPLAAKLKEKGKQAIHIGGATQLLFGIKGSRWEERETFKFLFNEHWVRPLPEETPQRAKSVENACYW